MLPNPRRDAMFAVYAFCRAVDDVADGLGPDQEKTRALTAWRQEVRALFAGGPTHPAMIALIPAVERFGLHQDDFMAVIEAMEMDVAGRMVAPTFEELDLYCDRAAGAVGMLSAPIFGLPEAEGKALARSLGRALQLTNVLRDLVEDAGDGRLYLPKEVLDRHGISTRAPAEVIAAPAIASVCADIAALADGYYLDARRIITACPRGPSRPACVILVVYARLLEKLNARGFAPEKISRPVRVNRPEKLFLVLRAYT
jgi:phytoene synthase